jgi:hypothetical protein
MTKRVISAAIGALAGYAGGAMVGGVAVLLFASSEVEQQAFMTGVFVTGPLGAIVGAIVGTYIGGRAPKSPPSSTTVSRGSAASAIGFGVIAALIVGQLMNWVLWPVIFASGIIDLQQIAGRMAFVAINALPAVLAGVITAWMSGMHRPMRNACITGALLIVPILFSLPTILRAYSLVPQSVLPLAVSIGLRPAGAIVGAFLVGIGVTRKAQPRSPAV